MRDPVNINWLEITQCACNPSMDLLWSGAETAQAVGDTIVAESAELLSRRFLENPMSIYEDSEIIVLSDWDDFKNLIRRIYNKRTAK